RLEFLVGPAQVADQPDAQLTEALLRRRREAGEAARAVQPAAPHHAAVAGDVAAEVPQIHGAFQRRHSPDHRECPVRRAADYRTTRAAESKRDDVRRQPPRAIDAAVTAP